MAETKGSVSAQQQGNQEERQQRGGQTGQGLQTRGQQRGGLEHRRGSGDFFAGAPFEFMRRMTEEMDRVFDRVFDDFGFGRRALTPRSVFGGAQSQREVLWSPRVEAFQKEDKFIVRAELPG